MRPARPPYVPDGAPYVPFSPHTYRSDPTRRYRLLVVVGAFLVVLAVVAGVALAAHAPRPVGPVFVTPNTYGPPASTGGPVITR